MKNGYFDSTGAELIAVERRRQQETEGWTKEHDDSHCADQLVHAADCYLMSDGQEWAEGETPYLWPWDMKWWKPKDRIHNLVVAGALIAAEIDRLQRKEKP